MKKLLCGFMCLAKHMCIQAAGQGWNSPRAACPGSLLGPRPASLKLGCQPPPPITVINSSSGPLPDVSTLATEGLKISAQRTLLKGGGDYWEGRVRLKAGRSLILPRSIGSRLQHSGSTHPWGQDTVSAESSFLVQRDPGPKPYSWWGLNAAGN